MAVSIVYVEINPETRLPIRIFRTRKDALSRPSEVVSTMAKNVAVGYIREQVISRARRGRLILCEFCGMIINEFLGEMHEVLPKGNGGEVSLDNSRFICHTCHSGRDGEHGDRYFGGRQRETNSPRRTLSEELEDAN